MFNAISKAVIEQQTLYKTVTGLYVIRHHSNNYKFDSHKKQQIIQNNSVLFFFVLKQNY